MEHTHILELRSRVIYYIELYLTFHGRNVIAFLLLKLINYCYCYQNITGLTIFQFSIIILYFVIHRNSIRMLRREARLFRASAQ